MIPQFHLTDFLLRKDDRFQIGDHLITLTDSTRGDLHYHNYYEFFFVLEGEILEYLNGEKTYVQKGWCGIRTPGDCHFMMSSERCDRNVIRNIAVERECFEEHLSRFSCGIEDLKKTSFLSRSCYSEFLALTGTVMRNMADAGVFDYILSQVLGNVLINARYIPQDDEAIPRWLRTLHAEMEKPENYIAGYDRMLEMTDRSREHLARCFQKYYHMNPTTFINTKRLEFAVSQLQTTDKKIIDIAYESGFDSISYFNKLFKQQYVLTPKNFREKIAKISI